MSLLDKTNHAQYREAQEQALRRVCHDIIDIHGNSPPILTVLQQNGFETLSDLILYAWDVIDDLVYSPTKGENPTHFSNYGCQYDRLTWFIKWELHLAVRNNYMPLNLDQWGALNRDDFDQFIISSGGKVEHATTTWYRQGYSNARENNTSKVDQTLKPPLDHRTIPQDHANKSLLPDVQSAPKNEHLDPIEGEMFSKSNAVERLTEGESIRISMPGTVDNETPRTALSIATLADEDPSIVVAAVASSNDHGIITGAVAPPFVSTTTNKLADDDPVVDAGNIVFDHEGTPLNNGTASFQQIRSYAYSVLNRCTAASKKGELSARRHEMKELDITKKKK